jgi:hypothetical protein
MNPHGGAGSSISGMDGKCISRISVHSNEKIDVLLHDGRGPV